MSLPTEIPLMINNSKMLIMPNMTLLMMLVSTIYGNMLEMLLKERRSLSCKLEIEIFQAMKLLMEMQVRINNSKIKMIQMMISLITTGSSTKSRETEILLRSDLPDHHSLLLKFKT